MSAQDNLIKIFEYALNQEQTGLNFFQSSIPRLGQGAAKGALEKLVGEEEKHISFINRVLTDLKQGSGLDPATVEGFVLAPVDFFDARAKSEFIESCVNDSMIPDVTVFNLAWLIEKDLVEFYAGAARQTEGAPKDAFAMLSRWEEGHEKFFRDFRDKLTETYSNMPWGG